jgi:hypothetical protein
MNLNNGMSSTTNLIVDLETMNRDKAQLEEKRDKLERQVASLMTGRSLRIC